MDKETKEAQELVNKLINNGYDQADRGKANAGLLGAIAVTVSVLLLIVSIAGLVAAVQTTDSDERLVFLTTSTTIVVLAVLYWAFLSAIRNVVGNGSVALELQTFAFAAQFLDDGDDEEDE